jgi:hypothetical protein
MALLVLAAVLFTAGCKQQPHRQPKFSDAELQAIRAGAPGMTEDCLTKLKWGGTEALPPKEEYCFKFTPPRRMHGLWRNSFEGSEYCDDSAGKCPDAKVEKDPKSFTWFALQLLPGWKDTPPGGLYKVDFIGRRSVGAGMFGHFGMSQNEVIVDRLLSIEEVEPPPPQPTKAETVKYLKQCEAARTCIPNWNEINGYDEARIMKAHREAYLKACAGKPICMPNSQMTKSK